MRPRVFITQPVYAGAVERLRLAADVALNPDPLHIMSKDELVNAVRGVTCFTVCCTTKSMPDVIGANPELIGIVSTTVTPADIDVAAASACRIPVTVVPASVMDDATADLAWALMMSVARRVAEADRLMRSGIVSRLAVLLHGRWRHRGTHARTHRHGRRRACGGERAQAFRCACSTTTRGAWMHRRNTRSA